MRMSKYAQWRHFWVCTFDGEMPVYKTDDEGNIIFINVPGVGDVPVETGEKQAAYKYLTDFDSNFSESGSETEAVVYGIDTSDYAGKFTVQSGFLDVDETALIWEEEPQFDENGHTSGKNADWRIVKISSTKNTDTFLLDAVTK